MRLQLSDNKKIISLAVANQVDELSQFFAWNSSNLNEIDASKYLNLKQLEWYTPLTVYRLKDKYFY